MKTLSLVFVTLAFMSLPAMAAPTKAFSCYLDRYQYDAYGHYLELTEFGRSIRLDKGRNLGTGLATLDTTYRPRPENTGSTRYLGKNECGKLTIILSRALTRGRSGQMTLIQDCESEGTGPSFISYSCRPMR